MIVIEQFIGFLMTLREIAGLVIMSLFEQPAGHNEAAHSGANVAAK